MNTVRKIENDKRVFELETAPDIFVYLKAGFRYGTDFSQDGNQCVHCFGEESFDDVLTSLQLVQKCNCDYCADRLAKNYDV